jgi:carboxypeptidase Taq
MAASVETDRLTELRDRIAEIVDLSQVAGVIGWDQETMMPPKGAQFRATQQAALQGIIHDRFTQPRVGELLAEFERAERLAQLGPVDQAVVRVVRRDYDRATKLPGSLVRELALATTQGVETWRHAREQSRWDLFAPDLERIVDLKRQQASYFGPAANPYDALLDEYEPGSTTAQLLPLFSALRHETVSLLAKIDRARRSLDRSVFQQSYPPAAQLAFGELVLRQMGFDFGAGRQDISTTKVVTPCTIKGFHLSSPEPGLAKGSRSASTNHNRGSGRIVSDGVCRSGSMRFPDYGSPSPIRPGRRRRR